MKKIITLFYFLFLSLNINSVNATNSSLKVQLQWFDQSQFAGFYVAQSRRYFDKENLDVELIPKSDERDPISILRSGEVDIAISNLNNIFVGGDDADQVTNIAQIFNKSGLQVLCRISKGVIRLSDLAGKKIGYWGIGDDNLVKSMLNQLGIPINQVEFVRQKPNGEDLINGNVDCATSMSYNESISILNSGVVEEDLMILSPEQFNLANIEDGIYVKTQRLKDEKFKNDLVKFVRAVRFGWEDARLAPNLAVETVLRKNQSLDYRFQQQMLDEILKLIPTEQENFGILNLKQYEQQIDQISKYTAKKDQRDQNWTYEVVNQLFKEDMRENIFSIATLYYVNQFVSNPIFQIIVLLGSLTFGLSSLLVAINRGYDLYGRFILCTLPSIGGGTIRDIVIGLERQPFFFVADISYMVGVILLVVSVSMLIHYNPNFIKSKNYKILKTYSELIGFSVLAILGPIIAINANMPLVWVPICAALTVAGGGMLRDIVINREPLTFRGVIYEEVAIIGGIIVMIGLYFANHFEHSPELVWLIVSGSILIMFGTMWIIDKKKIRYPAKKLFNKR